MGVWGERIFGLRVPMGQPVSVRRPLLAPPLTHDGLLVHKPPQSPDQSSFGDFALGLLGESILDDGVLFAARQDALYGLHRFREGDLLVGTQGVIIRSLYLSS